LLYKTYVTFPRRFLDAGKLLSELGNIFQVQQIAESYAGRIAEEFGRLTEEKSKAWKTLYLIWRNPWMAVNRDTFIHDVLELHHLENVTADRPERYPIVTKEEIEMANPDVIILPDEPFHFREKHVAELGSLRVKAVEKKQVFLADGTYFCWYGTRTARSSEYIRKHIMSRIN